MMKRILITVFIAVTALTFSNKAMAQHYNSAIGLRFGGTSGITYKAKGFEGILGFWGNGISLTGLAEKSTQAFGQSPELHWYYGFGGHVAFFNTNDPGNDYGRGARGYDDSTVGFGVDGIIGLEFTPDEIPFGFSLGIKPFIEIDTDGNVYGGPDPAIGIKYIIN